MTPQTATEEMGARSTLPQEEEQEEGAKISAEEALLWLTLICCPASRVLCRRRRTKRLNSCPLQCTFAALQKVLNSEYPFADDPNEKY